MRFVSPETVRIVLDASKDEWIEVKKELTVGEDFAFRTAGLGRKRSDESVEIDWEKRASARVMAYLVDWSEKRKLTQSAVLQLDPHEFERIDAAILGHMERMAAEKNAPAPNGASSLTPDSTSVA